MQQKQILKNATGVDTSSFTKKTDWAHLKSGVDKLEIGKLNNIASNISNFESIVDKLDIGKLENYSSWFK